MFNLHVIYLYQNFGARRRGRKESAATLGSAKAMSTTWEHEHGVLSSSFDVKPRKKSEIKLCPSPSPILAF